MEENFENIIAKSDAKICVDALSCLIHDRPWKICVLSTLSSSLGSSFSACVFFFVS